MSVTKSCPIRLRSGQAIFGGLVVDRVYLNSIDYTITILLRGGKINFFYSFVHKDLAILWFEKMC